MPDSETATRTLPLEKAAPVLAARVAQVQRRMGQVALGTGLAMAAPVLLAWLAIEMPLDWKFELPRWGRALFLLFGASTAFGIVWYFGIRPLLRRPNDEGTALAIERALPELRSRFIVSVQLSRDPAAHAQPLVKALVKDTTERSRDLEFSRVVSTDLLRRWLSVATAVVVIGAGLWFLGGKASWSLFQRAFLLNVPRPSNTLIVRWTGSLVSAAGDDLRIEASVAGVIPTKGILRVMPQNGNTLEFTLDADPADASRFLRVLQTVQQTFRYRLEIGDTRTDWASVEVRPRPVVVGLTLEQHWPAYTGLPPARKNPSDLKLLEGSDLAAMVKSNVPLQAGAIMLVGADRKVVSSATMLRSNAAQSTASTAIDWQGRIKIPAKDATGLTFNLTDEAGVQSQGMASYRLEIIPDHSPTLAILWPRHREELVTARATLLVAFEIKDDFGIDRLRLHYGVNWSPGAPHQSIDLDLGQKNPKSLNRRFEWDLSRIQPALKEGDALDYWFEVVDGNNVTGPGVTVQPEHYQARVVSDEEKRADLAARLSDTLRGLNDLRHNQDDLAKRLGEIIREKGQ